MQEYSLVSFSNGEITPKAMGRIDSPAYMNGCETLRNFIVMPQGAATRRPGSYMLDTMTSGTRLIEFEGTDGKGYVLAFHNLKMDVYYHGSEIASSDITAYWTTEQIKTIQFAIDGDEMYITHPEVAPYILTYDSSGPTFSFAAYVTSVGYPTGWDGNKPETDQPVGITFYEGRAIFLGGDSFPKHMWGSNVKKNTTFEEADPLLATDAFEVKISDNKGSRINWGIGARGVFVGTTKGVFSVSDENNLMSPVTLITAKQNSAFPACEIPGFFLGGELFYVQAGKRKIRLAMYDINVDRYITPDITAAAEHITEGYVKEVAVQNLPETIVWVVKENGELITFAYSQENKIMAWTHHDTEGDYKSIAVVREDDTEVVYAIVDRDGTGYLEKFAPIDFSGKDYMFLDCAKTQVFGSVFDISSVTWGATSITVVTTASHGYSTGDFVKVMDTGVDTLDYNIFQVEVVDTTTFKLLDEITGQYPIMDDFGTKDSGTVQEVDNLITGMTHLANKTVFVMSGPVPVGEYTVSASGEIQLETRRTEFTVGYNYFSDLVPMNIGLKKNTKKRITNVGIEVYKTLAGKEGKDEDNLDNFNYDKTIVMDVPQDLISGTVRVPHRGGHEFNGDIMIRQDLPLPMTVLSLTINVEVF